MTHECQVINPRSCGLKVTLLSQTPGWRLWMFLVMNLWQFNPDVSHLICVVLWVWDFHIVTVNFSQWKKCLNTFLSINWKNKPIHVLCCLVSVTVWLLQFVFTVPSSDILINFNILIRPQESTFPKISYCFFKFKLRTREHLMSTDLNRKMSSVSTLGKLIVLSSSSPSHVSSRPVWSSNTRLDLKSDAEVTFDLMEEEEEAATGVEWANV